MPKSKWLESVVDGLRWMMAPWPHKSARNHSKVSVSLQRTTMSECPPSNAASNAASNATTDPDLLTRPSWVNAKVAYLAVKKGKAGGNALSLWLRWRLQHHLFNLGCFIQRHCGKVLFLGLLVLSLCCIGLKTATMETDVHELWVQEGGRLHKELEYNKKILGEGSGSTSELVIQTPKEGENLLTVDSMLVHLEALQAAVEVEVDMYDVTWKFHDVCLTTTFPSFDDPLMDMILPKLLPCIIITPLDCFWEGSKLLGPDIPVFVPGATFVKWTNLNPKQMIENIDNMDIMGDNNAIDPIKEILERAGITSAYQKKPCLNPNDPSCPVTAPNKYTKQVPQLGSELTGGCKGFAERYMHWPEDLIIGGVTKNNSGQIIKAEAFQSILQLMGEKQMYEYYQNDYKVHSMDWTMEKANNVLQVWQRKFSQEIQRVKQTNSTASRRGRYNVYPFSSTSLLDLLNEFSQVSVLRVSLGYVLMLIYACLSLLRWSDAVHSQSGIGVAGVLLVVLAVAAGLGICSVIGIKFNASTTQILPFLALGLGVDDMFLLAHGFGEIAQNKHIQYMDETGECLRRTGVSVLLTSLINMAAFFIAAIIPIPALKAFVIQAGILMLVNLGAMLLVFPAIVSLDLMRRQDRRIDVFCCFHGSSSDKVHELQETSSATHEQQYRPSAQPPAQPPPYTPPESSCPHQPHAPSPPPAYSEHQSITCTQADGSCPTTVLGPAVPAPPPPPPTGPPLLSRIRGSARNAVFPETLSNPPSTTSSQQCLTSSNNNPAPCWPKCAKFSLSWFARSIYGPALSRTPVKVLVLLIFLVLIVAGVIGSLKVKDGLELTDIVPQHTNEYNFLNAQKEYFGFYNFYAVTMGDFDYPNNQQALHDYHQNFRWIEKIIKREDGTLPDYWLQLMREWLLDIQRSFDRDVALGRIVGDTWYHNATTEGILGYKLMVQTGDIDNPHNKERLSSGRLVDSDGIIYPDAFYNLLTAWVFNDALAYAASQADFMPWPDLSKEWVHDRQESVLEIPKWQPLTIAKFPFYLNNMVDTSDIVATIVEIRNICETAQATSGLPNYPSGIPFTFWEQYIGLRLYLTYALVAVLASVFVVVTALLLNPWAGALVVLSLGLILLQLFGLMGLVGIKLSAVPAVILIVAVGIGVPFTVHFVLGFVTSLGPRDHRMRACLEQRLAPVIHAAVSTLLGLIMLVGAEFDFIVKYFFVVLTGLLLLGLLNGAVLLPVLLSIIGPPAEVVPIDDPYSLPHPTPEPSPAPVPRGSRRGGSSGRSGGAAVSYPRIPSDLSLSTISEEPTQYSSTHEIIVHPEVVVETSVPGQAMYGSSPGSTSAESSPPESATSTPPLPQRQHFVTTKVRATATVKVEVHTPHLPQQQHQDNTAQQHYAYPKKMRRKVRPRPPAQQAPPPPQVPPQNTVVTFTNGSESEADESYT